MARLPSAAFRVRKPSAAFRIRKPSASFRGRVAAVPDPAVTATASRGGIAPRTASPRKN